MVAINLLRWIGRRNADKERIDGARARVRVLDFYTLNWAKLTIPSLLKKMSEKH